MALGHIGQTQSLRGGAGWQKMSNNHKKQCSVASCRWQRPLRRETLATRGDRTYSLGKLRQGHCFNIMQTSILQQYSNTSHIDCICTSGSNAQEWNPSARQ